MKNIVLGSLLLMSFASAYAEVEILETEAGCTSAINGNLCSGEWACKDAAKQRLERDTDEKVKILSVKFTEEKDGLIMDGFGIRVKNYSCIVEYERLSEDRFQWGRFNDDVEGKYNTSEEMQEGINSLSTILPKKTWERTDYHYKQLAIITSKIIHALKRNPQLVDETFVYINNIYDGADPMAKHKLDEILRAIAKLKQ